MEAYFKITIIENKRRIKLLKEFRENFEGWWNNVDKEWPETFENDTSGRYRKSINMVLREIDDIIMQSGVATTHYYSPPPAFGGAQGNINFILNIFRIFSMKMGPETITDMIDMSIGVYEKNIWPAIKRTINPFFWLDKFIGKLLSYPVRLVSTIFSIPYNTVDGNILTKLIKFILNCTVIGLGVLASIKTIFPDINFNQIIDDLFKI